MKKLTIITLSLVFFAGIGAFFVFRGGRHEKMKMYVFYTPSHESMFNDWFLPSLKKHDDYELVQEVFKQETAKGDWDDPMWFTTMSHKIDLLIRAIKENPNKIFVHSDVDIQFFGPSQEIIRTIMKDYDMVFQNDSPWGQPCAGFFACKGNQKTLMLWQKIRSMLMHPDNKKNDQLLLLDLIKFSNPYNVKWCFLPEDKFIGGGTHANMIWEPGKRLLVPQDVRVHHANSTIGVNNKVAQLEYVKEVVEQRHHGGALS